VHLKDYVKVQLLAGKVTDVQSKILQGVGKLCTASRPPRGHCGLEVHFKLTII